MITCVIDATLIIREDNMKCFLLSTTLQVVWKIGNFEVMEGELIVVHDILFIEKVISYL